MNIELNQYWRDMLQLPESEWELSDAALFIAKQAYPKLELETYRLRMRELCDALKEQCRPLANEDNTSEESAREESAREESVSEEKVFETLNEFVFSQQGFKGNVDDYSDPQNSYLNEVLDRKLGIPISLSIIYLTLARCVGLKAQGINFPGHFLVSVETSQHTLFVDPFEQGKILDVVALRKLLTKFIDIENQQPIDNYLQPASNTEILVRLLRNLKNLYIENQEVEKSLAIIQLILSLIPESPDELRDRGMIYQHIEYTSGALHDLQRFLELEPDSTERPIIEAVIESLNGQTLPLH